MFYKELHGLIKNIQLKFENIRFGASHIYLRYFT